MQGTDFFISYSRADRAWAEWIAWQLEDAGYTTVLQAWDFRPGGNFALDMANASAKAQRTIAVLSQDYVSAAYTQSEWAHAFASDPTGARGALLPVRVGDVKLVGLMATISYVDLVGLTEPAARAELLRAVSPGRGKPKAPPLFPSADVRSEQVRPEFPSKDQRIAAVVLLSVKDQLLWEGLERHLQRLARDEVPISWTAFIVESLDSTPEWGTAANGADVVLPLISADFLAADFVYDVEVRNLIERHQVGASRVVPVILRPVDWQASPFGKLQALPRDAIPVTSWDNRDEAFLTITSGVRLACQELLGQLPLGPVSVSNEVYSLTDVFKPSGIPSVTFIEPPDFYLLKLALQGPGRGVVIEGPSGIGKTTALRKATEQVRQSSRTSGDIPILSARRSADLERISNLQEWHSGTVAIDDFHRLRAELQEKLADYLKFLADEENPRKKLVIVGIPGTGQELVQMAFDIANRVDVFRLGKVEDGIVLNMIERGESALNIILERKSDLVTAASGSLNIAQILCYHIAARAGVLSTQTSTVRIATDVGAAIVKALEPLEAKFGRFVRAFAALGGPSDYTATDLLSEVGASLDGLISLNRLQITRPELRRGLDTFVAHRYMDALRSAMPEVDNFLLFDDHRRLLLVEDPQLIFYLKRTPPEALARLAGKSEVSNKSNVFISYSHSDAEWVERVRVHLRPLERKGLIDIWADTRIQAGSLWREELRRALSAARVAILLVSAEFLASDFVQENELPVLLDAAEKGGTRVLPLIVGASRFSRVPELSKFQAVNAPDKPLAGLPVFAQDEVLERMSAAVEMALAHSQGDEQ